jgi:hypothetical protein
MTVLDLRQVNEITGELPAWLEKPKTGSYLIESGRYWPHDDRRP